MIGYIKGIVEEIREDHIFLEKDGIGFRIFISGSFYRDGYHRGDAVKLYTHLYVKEDIMQLYGFTRQDELEVFRMLIGVSGIGPKGAMGVLSAIPVDDLRFAILSEDVKAISKAPGIGRKTAQKMILELKDKFDLEESFEAKLSNKEAEKSALSADSMQEAIQALTALGYSATEALQAVKKVEGAENMDTEEILKASLRQLF